MNSLRLLSARLTRLSEALYESLIDRKGHLVKIEKDAFSLFIHTNREALSEI